MECTLEYQPPEAITYKRGAVCVFLTGMNAALYRMMIWQYGKEEATERFWWLWHKKETAPAPQLRRSPLE